MDDIRFKFDYRLCFMNSQQQFTIGNRPLQLQTCQLDSLQLSFSCYCCEDRYFTSLPYVCRITVGTQDHIACSTAHIAGSFSIVWKLSISTGTLQLITATPYNSTMTLTNSACMYSSRKVRQSRLSQSSVMCPPYMISPNR